MTHCLVFEEMWNIKQVDQNHVTVVLASRRIGLMLTSLNVKIVTAAMVASEAAFAGSESFLLSKRAVSAL